MFGHFSIGVVGQLWATLFQVSFVHIMNFFVESQLVE